MKEPPGGRVTSAILSATCELYSATMPGVILTDSNVIGHNCNRKRSVLEIQAEKYASLSRLAENTVLSSCKSSTLDVWVWDATGITPMYIHALRSRGWRFAIVTKMLRGMARMQMAARHQFRKPVRCVVRHAGVPSPNTIKT